MSIVRINHDKENPYTLINKTALEDDDLSWAAKGLWSYLISRPDNWNVSVKHLVSSFQKEGKKGGGRDAVHNLLNELIKFGYCIRILHKTSKGLFDYWEYIVLEHKKLKETLPKQDNPDMDPDTGYPDTVKPDYNNKGSKINKDTTTPTPKVAVVLKKPLNEEEQVFFEKICADPRLFWLSDVDKRKAIKDFGIPIVRKMLKHMCIANPEFRENKIPHGMRHPGMIFRKLCREEQEG